MDNRKWTNDEERPLISEESIYTVESKWKVISRELLALFKIAIPVILTNLSAFLLLTESVIMTGQLSKYDLDASSLANSIINVIGIAIGTGLCTACDTYFSQMYSSKYKKSIGMILQKSIMIISLFPIVLIALHLNMEPLLILMGQHEEVTKKAAQYITLFSPGLIFAFNYIILTRYMQSQNKVFAPMIIGILVNIFNITSQYLSIYKFQLGLYASAVCQAISFFLFWLIQLIYILASKTYMDTWNGWTKDSFLEWGLFAKLAIPGAAMVVLECFCFEIGTILSGVMGTVQLAAQSILFQLETITFMISFGVGVAVNIRVGQALGKGNYEMALRSYRCGVILMVMSFAITASVLLGFMNQLPILFTQDREAQKMASDLLPILIGVQFFDAIGTVTMGALRGCGRQNICVIIIFCSYYLLGQPIGISLAFAGGLQVKGLWIGLLVSLAICVPIAFIYTNFIQNWKLQAENCHKRITKAAFEDENDECENMYLSNSTEVVMVSHKRSLSKSFVPTNKVIMARTIEVNEKVYKKNIFKRLIILFCAILVLIAGVLLHIFLPRKIYLHNVTINKP